MREIGWHSVDGTPLVANGNPWNVADFCAAEGKSTRDEAWQTNEYFLHSKAGACVAAVIEEFDALMAELGYTREGEYYRVTGEHTDRTVAIFSHGGSSTAVLSHLFNIPFPQLCGMLHPDFTSVTVVELSDKAGALIYPLLLSTDAHHIKNLKADIVYED